MVVKYKTDSVSYKSIYIVIDRTSVCCSVVRHFALQNVILRVLVNGEGLCLMLEKLLPLSLENVSERSIRLVALECMSRLRFCCSTLKEHGKKVSPQSFAYHNAILKF